MKRFMKQFRYGEKGFTLIELLVVVSILAIISVVVVPNVGKFMGRGRTAAYKAEVHNVRIAVMAMLTDSTAGELDVAVSATDDMDTVTADSGALLLSSYIVGLNADGTVKSGCTYAFTIDGAVTQTTP